MGNVPTEQFFPSNFVSSLLICIEIPYPNYLIINHFIFKEYISKIRVGKNDKFEYFSRL